MLLPNQTQAISDMSALLYDFLPGKAHPYANQEISFLGAARKVGLDKHWLGGSKQPSIAMLLSRTYEFDKGRFCDLITAIINYGIIYRTQKKNPVTRDEIEKLNAIILKLSFKIPQLWDKSFLDNLSGNKKKTTETSTKPANYDALLTAFMKLKDMDNSQSRGFAFEKFLNELFDEFELNPRKSFKLVGEQIDGSLELDKEIYLIEAKWQKTPLGQSDLLIFNGKDRRKVKMDERDNY